MIMRTRRRRMRRRKRMLLKIRDSSLLKPAFVICPMSSKCPEYRSARQPTEICFCLFEITASVEMTLPRRMTTNTL